MCYYRVGELRGERRIWKSKINSYFINKYFTYIILRMSCFRIFYYFKQKKLKFFINKKILLF